MSRAKIKTLSFDEWLKQMNEALENKFALSSADLPGKTWQEWFDEGMSPGAAATLAMEEEGCSVTG
jgi:hypothetical protein